MAPGDVFVLSIGDVAYGGMGVGRHEGWVVFVAGALAGEQVKVRLTDRRRNFWNAELLEVVAPSPHRIEPACDLFPQCPGCRYQHADYGEELRIKQRQLTDLLRRMGGTQPESMAEPVASPTPLEYRNKLVLHAAAHGDERALGYFMDDNRSIVDVARCPLGVPALNDRLAELRSDAGFTAALAPHVRVTLRWTTHDGAVSWTSRDRRDLPVLTEQTRAGSLRVPAEAFFQVNPPVADRLVDAVREAIRAVSPARFIDAYCGVGVFALAAAGSGVPDVVGVDSDAAAIAAARGNAAALGLKGARFEDRPAQDALGALLDRSAADRTVLLLDPPRTGLFPSVVAQIVRQRPAHVLYVSCAADTLARDIARLRQAGYRLASAGLFDMFPRTPYFETLAHLCCE